MCSLYNLPDEILLIIFNLCNINTLSQINVVCKRFCSISQEILTKKADYLLVTNQVSEKFRER